MAKIPREFDPTAEYQRRIEKTFDAVHFDEMLAMAEKVCLVDPAPPNIRRGDLSNEQKLIAKVGLSGIRAALDFIHGGELQLSLPPQREDNPDELWMCPDLLIREPRFFADGFDYDQAARVEAFGAQLMRESWRCLGPEAEEMIQAFKNATSDEEQHPVLDWLDSRLWEMARPSTFSEMDTIYHPLRLSPKAMGVYPNMNTFPTCLSVSVIAAGFFREAGADVLHTGVVETGKQQLQQDLIWECKEGIAKQAQRLYGIDIPPLLSERLTNRAATLAKWGADPEGVHACLLVRTRSGKWSQFDSNFRLSTKLPTVMGKDRDIDSVHTELTSLQTLVPGMEFFITSGMTSIVPFIRAVNRGNTNYAVDRDQVRDVLRGDPDRVLADIRRIVVDPLFDYPTDNAGYVVLQRMVKDAAGGDSGELNLLDMAYEDALLSWLLDLEEVERIVAKCREDPEYLERKVIDALLMGPLTAHLLAANIFDNNDRVPAGGSIHNVLEVGLPEPAIGNAVLSEFTRHLGNTLSSHYWLSQWPSVLAASEKKDLLHTSEAQTIALLNAMEVFDTKRFTFDDDHGKTVDILKKYRLSDTDNEE